MRASSGSVIVPRREPHATTKIVDSLVQVVVARMRRGDVHERGGRSRREPVPEPVLGGINRSRGALFIGSYEP